jgi:signal transduction histidine kinase
VSNDVSWADIAAVVDLHSCSWPLAAIDEQLIVLRANPAFAALCGAEQLRETQSVVGASLASLWGQSAALVALQQEIARGRARRFKATVEQRLPDEASRELELSLSPLEGGNKQCWAVAVEQPNLTQLTHTNRLATIGTLTAALAHELGTPLNVITARGQMIVRGVTRGDRTILEDIYSDPQKVISRDGLGVEGKARGGRLLAGKQPTSLPAWRGNEPQRRPPRRNAEGHAAIGVQNQRLFTFLWRAVLGRHRRARR